MFWGIIWINRLIVRIIIISTTFKNFEWKTYIMCIYGCNILL